MGRPRWALLAGAALFSTGGAAIKACSLPGWEISAWRSGIAALVLLVAFPSARRGWTWRTGLVGLAYAATVTLFVLSNKHTTAAAAIFLQSTAPLYLLLLAPVLLRERVRRSDLGAGLAMAIGLGFVLVGTRQGTVSAPDPALGNTLAASAGFCWALTILGLRWLGRGVTGNPVAPIAVGSLISMAVCLIWALPLSPVAGPDLAVLLYLGAFQIGLAYVLVSGGLTRVPAMEASILLLAEPALSPLWAWWVHDEVPTAAVIAGGCLIFATTLVVSLKPGANGQK